MYVGRTPHYFVGRGRALCCADLMQSSRACEPNTESKGCCSKCWFLSQKLDSDQLHAMKASGAS